MHRRQRHALLDAFDDIGIDNARISELCSSMRHAVTNGMKRSDAFGFQ
jgi:hypothetical protein